MQRSTADCLLASYQETKVDVWNYGRNSHNVQSINVYVLNWTSCLKGHIDQHQPHRCYSGETIWPKMIQGDPAAVRRRKPISRHATKRSHIQITTSSNAAIFALVNRRYPMRCRTSIVAVETAITQEPIRGTYHSHHNGV